MFYLESSIFGSHKINLEKIMNSGQVFSMEKREKPDSGQKYYAIQSGSHFVAAIPLNTCVTTYAFNCSETDFMSIWMPYFDLPDQRDKFDHSIYAAAFEHIRPEDEFLYKAAVFSSGVRILRQDLFETIISYLVSQNNNIPRIKKTLQAFRERFGTAMQDKYTGMPYFAFPTAAQFLANEQEIFDAGAGYRTDYILNFCNIVENICPDYLETLKKLTYAGAKRSLMQFNGIGEKVADCICLYGLGHLQALPTDTWIKKIENGQYDGRFPWRDYQYAGIYQQWIYYYAQFYAKQKRLHKAGTLNADVFN